MQPWQLGKTCGLQLPEVSSQLILRLPRLDTPALRGRLASTLSLQFYLTPNILDSEEVFLAETSDPHDLGDAETLSHAAFAFEVGN